MQHEIFFVAEFSLAGLECRPALELDGLRSALVPQRIRE